MLFSVVFLAEISVGGSGAWSEKLIGFSFRKLLFVLISLFLILIFSSRAKVPFYYFFIFLWFRCFFIVWGAFCLILTITGGAIFKMLLSLFGLTALCIVAVIGSDRVLLSIVSAAFCFSFVLAVLHCILYFGFSAGAIDVSWVNDFFYQYLAGKGEIFIFTKEPSIRVFWASTSFILVGYTIALFGFLKSNGFFSPLVDSFFVLWIFVFAAYASDTRALLGYMAFVPVSYVFFRVAAYLLYPFSSGVKIALYVFGMVMVELLLLLAVTPSVLKVLGLNKEGRGLNVLIRSKRYIIPCLRIYFGVLVWVATPST
ncbi:hypothetical protein N5938_27760 [Pseudomonas aeruginosa]|uniref:hypothetical protein n=1 Tax=Pseudomonas aeruginosa TaxID=287 RepID=UPI0021F11164|nr:hypothetical protein [Pseudomonas aeruginosa]UYM60266.1 hypothetical protein N5938_27760 [Pseudomonas aeruginosa]